MEIAASDRRSLLSLIDQFHRQTIVVLGDLVADEFIQGEISRVSREAPVLILKQRGKQILPGGGANAANNLIDLEARAEIFGFVGDDASGEVLLTYFQAKGAATGNIVRQPKHVTPTKSRVLGGLGHGHWQQIVRVDREPEGAPDEMMRRKLSRSVLGALPRATAILVSDYGYGSTSPREAEFLRQRLPRKDFPVTADSRYNTLAYRRLTALTPNESEMEAAFGQPMASSIETLHKFAAGMLRSSSLRALLVTRGREGMVLYQRQCSPHLLPIFGSDQVADVTGAGDTVIAAFTLALASGASFVHAAMLANCAGGLVVMKSGTATVTRRELRNAIQNA